jgi:hypothetical protein
VTRQPATDRYDALVDLEPRPPGELPRYAYALLKITYQVSDGRAVPAPAEPLLFDVYRDETLVPRLPPGSDFWVNKAATDVVLLGSAFTRSGKAATAMEVSAQVGPLSKRIAVFGRRQLDWRPGGIVSVPDPEPFTEMPIIPPLAYGGLDPRVPLPPELEPQWMEHAKRGLAFDHPGLYPRNPIGKGYLVYPDPPMRGLELPNLEDPNDRLTPQRLFARSPELWHRQPLPWNFDWTSPLSYPRELYAGMDAWHPCPDLAQLPEVQRGFAPGLQKSPGGPLPEFHQEASLGMVARVPLAGAPVVVTGMHPEDPALSFTLPPPLPISIEIGGERLPLNPQLTNLVIIPGQRKFYVVYFARTAALPRYFVPGIHQHIPLAAYIANDPPIAYVTPPTIRERLAAANQT